MTTMLIPLDIELLFAVALASAALSLALLLTVAMLARRLRKELSASRAALTILKRDIKAVADGRRVDELLK